MYLVEREFPEILKFYRVDDLDLVFDGFEPVDPDTIHYYFHNPANGDLYVIELTDYVHEFRANGEVLMWIVENYWEDHSCEWQVERWLSHNDSTDYTDLDNWFYWPECGEKCVMAQLKANASELADRKLERNLPDISEEQMADRREKVEGLIEIDNQR